MMIAKIRKSIKKYKEKKYWEKRANLWEDFKSNNKIEEMKCGLVKKTEYYTPGIWEYDCNSRPCYNKEFFDKYGCEYIKNFLNY